MGDVTVEVECRGEVHRISVTADGDVVLHDHDTAGERALAAMVGDAAGRCAEVLTAWELLVRDVAALKWWKPSIHPFVDDLYTDDADDGSARRILLEQRQQLTGRRAPPPKLQGRAVGHLDRLLRIATLPPPLRRRLGEVQLAEVLRRPPERRAAVLREAANMWIALATGLTAPAPEGPFDGRRSVLSRLGATVDERWVERVVVPGRAIVDGLLVLDVDDDGTATVVVWDDPGEDSDGPEPRLAPARIDRDPASGDWRLRLDD